MFHSRDIFLDLDIRREKRCINKPDNNKVIFFIFKLVFIITPYNLIH